MKSSASTTNANPNRPPRSTQFTYVNEDSIPEHLKCKICFLPLEDALMHKACEELFCRSCIEGFHTCPNCRADMVVSDLMPAFRMLRNTLDELQVICSTCKGSVARGSLDDHSTKSCPLLDAKIELNQKRIEMEQEMKAEKQKMLKEIEEWRTKEAQTLKKEIQKEKSQLETERKKLEEERNQFEKRKNVFGQHLKETDPVDINVRGQMMTVGYGTLTKKNSLLSKMFTGEHPIHQGKDGRYFIDCDPCHFTILLNWLVYDRVDPGDVNHLSKVAELFQFEPIKAQKQVLTQSEFNHLYNEQKQNLPLFLNSWNLSGLNLSGLDLSKFSLIDCDLSKCKLMNTNLSGANLHGADLTGCLAIKTNFSSANLSDAKISQGKFDGCHFLSADLSTVNIGEATFDGCNFTSTDLSNVDVRTMNLASCDLTSTNLTRDQVIALIASRGRLCKLSLVGYNLSNIDISGVSLTQCNLNNCDLSGCILKDTTFDQCDMTGAKLDNCQLPLAKMIDTTLSQVKLTVQQVIDVARKGNTPILDLENMDFSNCDLSGLNLSRSNCSGAIFVNTKLVDTNLTSSVLTNSNLTGANIENANFFEANTSGCTGCLIPSYFVPNNHVGTFTNGSKRFKNGKEKTFSIVGSTIVDQFSIRLLTCWTGLRIGVRSVARYSTWYFDCDSGHLLLGSEFNHYTCSGNQSANAKGTVITVNLKNRELSFTVNGRELGVVPSNPLKKWENDFFLPLVSGVHGCENGEFEIFP